MPWLASLTTVARCSLAVALAHGRMKRSKPSTKKSCVVELLPPQAAAVGVVSAAFSSCAAPRLLLLCEM